MGGAADVNGFAGVGRGGGAASGEAAPPAGRDAVAGLAGAAGAAGLAGAAGAAPGLAPSAPEPTNIVFMTGLAFAAGAAPAAGASTADPQAPQNLMLSSTWALHFGHVFIDDLLGSLLGGRLRGRR
jgi:hypothetical protein